MKTNFVLGCLLVSANIAAGQTLLDPSATQSVSSIFSADEVAEPLAASSTPASFQYIIAHWPYGQEFSTQVMLANSGTTTAKVVVQFFNQAGASFSVPLSGAGLKSRDSVSVAPNDVAVLATETSARENSSLEVAWGIATSTAPLNVFSLFDFGLSSTSITGAVGAQSTVAATSFRFPVSVGGPGKFTAGMAIANPGNSTANVTVMVMNSNGSQMGQFVETLPADNQTIFTLDSKLDFSSFNSTAFTGSVAVCSSEPIGLVTVGFEGGAFFSTSVTNDPCPN
jgi:hypothetical protein